MKSQLIGLLMIITSFVIFVYYTTWLFIVPSLNKDNILNDYFLSVEIAIWGPIYLLFIGSFFIGAFLLKMNMKKKKKNVI